MALQLQYQQSEQAYLKAYPTTIQEFKQDEFTPKVFITYVIYSIFSDNTKTTMLYGNAFEMNIDPNESVYEQIYDKIQEQYPNSIKI